MSDANNSSRGHRFVHGHTVDENGLRKISPTYRCWQMMLDRCYRVKSKSYRRYGGRGILVCERWHNFENFLADMGERELGTSIDRIDNNKGYSLENCRWATPVEQARNTSRNRWLECDGQIKTMAEWSEITGISANIIEQRLRVLKWSVRSALSRPPRIIFRTKIENRT